MQPKVDDVRAKQGRSGRHAFAILAISLALAAIAFVVYIGWVWQTTPPFDETAQEPLATEEPALISPANDANPVPTAEPN